MKKPVRKSKYQHYMADSFAQCGLEAKRNNDPGRSITLYEHALNFELEAINAFSDGTLTSVDLITLYRNAVAYALECGRKNKAKHLIEAMLAQDLSAEMIAEFELTIRGKLVYINEFSSTCGFCASHVEFSGISTSEKGQGHVRPRRL